MILTAKKHKTAAATVLVGACVVGGGIGYAAATAGDPIRDAAVRACQASVRPGGVRFILAEQIRFQIHQARTFDYSKFFPNVPPNQLHALIEAQLDRQTREIHDLLDVDCAAQYR